MAQASVAPYLCMFGVSPDLPLLFALSWVLLQGLGEGIIVSLVAGVALDALSGGIFGLSVLSMALSSGLAGIAEVNVFRSARFLPYIMAALTTPLYYAIYLGLVQLLGGGRAPVTLVWRLVLPTTVTNLVFMLPVYQLVKLLCAHTRPKQAEWQ